MAQMQSLRSALTSRLIRGATISSVHQAIAFDAVASLGRPDGDMWQRLFLLHAPTFAAGARAPDVEFRDFKNHHLFPDADMMCGAADKAQCWYSNLVAALRKGEWANAIFCAGVLSHYIVDALHPFHSTQSAADNDIYAALELTTWVTYRSLARLGERLPGTIDIVTAATLSDTLHSGAKMARQHYAPLLAHFDLLRAVVDPRLGLDADGQVEMASILGRATRCVAAVLDAAIVESMATAPSSLLLLRAGIACVGWPVAAYCRWWTARVHRRALKATAHEVASTGRAALTLPLEVRVKRDLYARVGRTAVGSGAVIVFPRRHFAPARAATGEAIIIDLDAKFGMAAKRPTGARDMTR